MPSPTRTHTQHATRHTATIATAALLLTACATDEEPTPIFAEPTASSQSSTGPQPGRESAREYIERWNTAQTAMYAGDVDAYAEEYKQCNVCLQTAERARRYLDDGGYIKTEGREILSVKREFSEAERVHFLVEVNGASTEYAERAGADVQHLSGGPATFRMTLAREPLTWSLLTYVELAR